MEMICLRASEGIETPCFVLQETHAVREPNRLPDIWAEQTATELDRGESSFIAHMESNETSTLHRFHA